MDDNGPIEKIQAGVTARQIAHLDRDPPKPDVKPMRPRDAATILILDRTPDGLKVLMGRRHRGHAFMPGKFVFPGGRVDPHDGNVPAAAELDPVDLSKLLQGMGSRPSPRRARALALAAIRETYEEAGLLIGHNGDFGYDHGDWHAFAAHGIAPDLSSLRFVARAVTPPGRVRRFDTRFFVAFREAIAASLPEGTGPSGELEDLHWLTFGETNSLELPPITRTILSEVAERYADDPGLTAGIPVVQYSMRHNRFVREVI